MTDGDAPSVHATALALGMRGRVVGVLITGPSGAGKSTLAVTLIERARQGGRFARLVADDRTVLSVASGRLVARAPDRLAGLMEVRGLGIVEVERLPNCRIHAQVALVPSGSVERMPEPASSEWEVDGTTVRLARLDVPAGMFEPAARLVEHWLAQVSRYENMGS